MPQDGNGKRNLPAGTNIQTVEEAGGSVLRISTHKRTRFAEQEINSGNQYLQGHSSQNEDDEKTKLIKDKEKEELAKQQCQDAINTYYEVQKKTKNWNNFIDEPDDEVENNGHCMHYAAVVAKYLTVIVLTIAVFLGAVVTMATLLVTTNAYSRKYDTRDTRCIDVDGRFVRQHVMLILLTCLSFPEALSFLSCLYNVKRDEDKKMRGKWKSFFVGLAPELLHALGITILTFFVLPYLDATLSVMTFSLVGIVPSVLDIPFKFIAMEQRQNKLNAKRKNDKTTASRTQSKANGSHQNHSAEEENREGKRESREKENSDGEAKRCKIPVNWEKVKFVFSISALILQILGIGFLCLQIIATYETSIANRVTPPTTMAMMVACVSSLLMISSRHWENFVSYSSFTKSRVLNGIRSVRNELDDVRYKVGIIYSLLRLAVIAIPASIIYFGVQANSNIVTETGKKFTDYNPGATCHRFVRNLWLGGITHCLCSFGVFYFGKISRMIQIQSSNLPFVLVSPVMFALTAVNSHVILETGNKSNGLTLLVAFFSPGNSQWEHPTTMNAVYKYIGWTSGYVGADQKQILITVTAGLILGWLAITLLTSYIWRSNSVLLPKTKDLYVKPIFGGVTIDQDMLLNKRQYYIPRTKQKETEAKNQSTPVVFLCATMWHETEQEMTQLITSIMRLDKDQKQRSNTGKELYTFEVHIIFDDAMENSPKGRKPNKFVDQLLEVVTPAAKRVHKKKESNKQHNDSTANTEEDAFKVKEPILYTTPYGGRIEFELPCKNKFIIHLKDKSRIRHRKRWSQCMYMYYILGFQVEQQNKYSKEDVYILALDGDVDFQPESLTRLLDRMGRNPEKVGAACGRIHPVGSGPVAWFQKFEYAVGHWLQKTAEHVLGCVLCSPGCFSLFNGKALMDKNIMKRYTTEPKEPRHHIQWDQGEDRWLCTLLLKKGYKIEYCALSDSFTFCPEEFKEFYNQRRRWVPSTMANIFEILENSSLAVTNNDYISWGYIAYQTGLMVSSLLGPATVILVIQGAFQYVFRMAPFPSLLLSIVPIFIYVILCYTTKQDFQVGVAAILTILYALVMMAVLVGVIGQMAETLLNPNSIFMIVMVFMYAFTGIIHPKEISCLLHGVLYYLCVPSAFILLMVYSLCNMNNVSWGTREVKSAEDILKEYQEEQDRKDAKEKKKIEKEKKKENEGGGRIDKYTSDIHTSTDDGYSFGCGDFCKITCCFKQKSHTLSLPDDENRRRKRRKTTFVPRKSSSLEGGIPIEEIQKVPGLSTMADVRSHFLKEDELDELRKEHLDKVTGASGADDIENTGMTLDLLRREEEKNESVSWVKEGPLGNGQLRTITSDEWVFWKEMIKEYLEPIDYDKEKQEKVKAELVTLKNKMTGAYFLINSLWIVLTFSLTLAIDDINITFYDKNGNEIVLQPLSFLFLLFFIVILFIQFFTMLAHRWSTFVHLMAETSFSFKRNESEDATFEPTNTDRRQASPNPKVSVSTNSTPIDHPGIENFEYGMAESIGQPPEQPLRLRRTGDVFWSNESRSNMIPMQSRPRSLPRQTFNSDAATSREENSAFDLDF